jgi:purine-binding chemotaxis protein CheW
MTASTGTPRVASPARGLCTFWLNDRYFGLDVSLVGEVVAVDAVIPVALAPPSVRGLFNLRGTPVALLELATVLGLTEAQRTSARTQSALVLRHEELTVAVVIDAMDAVVASERGTFAEPGARDHPAVKGFLELEGAAARVVTVLDPAVLLERLEAVRFASAAD